MRVTTTLDTVLICCLRAEKYATNPFFGLGHLKTKTNRRVSHVTLTYFRVYKCLLNNTVLSDFQYCIQLMLKNQANIKTHPKKNYDKYHDFHCKHKVQTVPGSSNPIYCHARSTRADDLLMSTVLQR